VLTAYFQPRIQKRGLKIKKCFDAVTGKKFCSGKTNFILPCVFHFNPYRITDSCGSENQVKEEKEAGNNVETK